jgi:D-sedoheptulose 7-phosphate isomerase
MANSTDEMARLRSHVEGSIETKRKLLAVAAESILEAARIMTHCLSEGGKILLCGNGGSAADAQHIAAEFVSALNHHAFMRPGIAAIAITTDTSFLTASGNDFGFAGVFERQVQALGRPGDVVIGISTSGKSENVLRALDYAQTHGMHAIGLAGENGGKMLVPGRTVVRVPSEVTQFVQETHIMIGHILCDLVERSLTYHEHGVAGKVSAE